VSPILFEEDSEIKESLSFEEEFGSI